MARYRIGNDMTIIWSVTNKDGSSFPLAGKEVHLYYTCERGRFEADIQIQDNVVAWDFAGRDQRVLGGYTLTLEVIQPGGKRIIRKDICNAFTLVGKGCEENYTPGDADINEGGEITLASELDVYKIQPIIPTVGSNSNWFVDGTDTGKPSTGKSAYEYAKEKGYEGTESEYAESLKLAPENAEKLTELRAQVLDFTIYEINNAIEKNGGVIHRVINQTPIINALKNNTLIVIPIGAYSDGYCVVHGELDGAGTLSIEFDYARFHYSVYIESKVIEADKEKIGYNIVIDKELSSTSTNPVQNKVIESKFSSVSAENERLKERIEEQAIFIEDLQDMKIDREADDYYPKLAVGLADNLAGVDVVDSEINFRRSGGGAISDGVARIETIKGNSVVWNQWTNSSANSATKTENGVTFTKNEDGSFSVVTDSDGATANTYIQIGSGISVINTHKYILYGAAQGGRFETYNAYATNGFANEIYDYGAGAFGTSIGGYTFVVIIVKSGQVISSPLKFSMKLIDLTQMFGAGNEPTTIEEFYARKPMNIEDENSYNEGEVIHIDVQSIESQGVNAWDEEWEMGYIDASNGNTIYALNHICAKNKIHILPNTTYHFTKPAGAYTIIAYYDMDGLYIGQQDLFATSGIGGTFKTVENAHYMRFYCAIPEYNHDICINISDASVNGKYFPHIKRVEDLAVIRKYFPQGMKSAGSAHDEIRYNKATQKWEYSKGKIKTLRLADLVWYYAPTQGYFYSNDIDNLKGIETTKINILCDVIVSCGWSNFVINYTSNKATRIASYTATTTTTTTRSRVNILNVAYTDVSAFLAWLEEANATLYYESNDWEWVELDAEDQFKDLDYQVWNCGTEKAIAEGKSAPLAADISYGFNAIGKIKELESLVAALRAKVGI